MAVEILPKHIRQAVWSARLAKYDVTDKICVQNLEVTANAGVDVWGRRKSQRTQITVTLHLARPFDSAAEADALDKSTVHYGKLSKDIQNRVHSLPEWKTTSGLAGEILKQIMETKGDTGLIATEIDVLYPKSSMLGEGAGFSLSSTHVGEDLEISTVLYIRNVRIPCLIGVNSNERTAKQPVVVNLWAECVRPSRTDAYTELEAVVVNVSGAPFSPELS
jgi:FolB domain-containing protein